MAAMKPIIAVIAAVMGLIAACFMLGTCTMRERMLGTYEGYRDVKVNPGTDPIVADQLRQVRIVAKVDGTATLSDQGMGVNGRIEYGQTTATFIPEKIADIKIEYEPPELEKQYTVTLKPEPDGTWLYAGSVKLSKKG